MSAKGRSRARISPEARSAEGSPISAAGPPKTAQLQSASGGSAEAELTNDAANVGAQ
jgi:hypothetical protein